MYVYIFFSILPKNHNYADYCINFEMLFRSVKSDTNLPIGTLEVLCSRSDTDLPIGTLEFLRTRIKDVAFSAFREFNESRFRENNLSKEEHEWLTKLAGNKDIIILLLF